LDEIAVVFPVPGKAQVVAGHPAGIIKRKNGNGLRKTPPGGGVSQLS
jgi:hypothetical protein